MGLIESLDLKQKSIKPLRPFNKSKAIVLISQPRSSKQLEVILRSIESNTASPERIYIHCAKRLSRKYHTENRSHCEYLDSGLSIKSAMILASTRYPEHFFFVSVRGQAFLPENFEVCIKYLSTNTDAPYVSYLTYLCDCDYIARKEVVSGEVFSKNELEMRLGLSAFRTSFIIQNDKLLSEMPLKKVDGHFIAKPFSFSPILKRFSPLILKNNWRDHEIEIDTSLRRYQGIHRNKRCFVIGNGPSLNKMNLDLLKDEITFASNAFFLMFSKINWLPTYYSCTDAVVLPDRAADICRMCEDYPEIQSFFNIHFGTEQSWKLKWWTPSLIYPRSNTNYFKQRKLVWSTNPEDAFSVDSHRGVVGGKSVTLVLLQLAVIMRCNPIYLIGCDTNYNLDQNFDRFKNVSKQDSDICHSLDSHDTCHFHPDYWGKGRAWHYPDLKPIIRQYQAGRKASEKLGIQIYNAGVGGKLEVFDRMDFRAIFQN